MFKLNQQMHKLLINIFHLITPYTYFGNLITIFHTDDPQILGATVLNLLSKAPWRQGSVHPWCKCTLWVIFLIKL
jgi:hypothetical protein